MNDSVITGVSILVVTLFVSLAVANIVLEKTKDRVRKLEKTLERLLGCELEPCQSCKGRIRSVLDEE